MEVELSHMTEMIYDLALEIIFLLTGEKHAAVKMASIEGLLQCMYPPLSVGGSLSQTLTTKPPSYARIPEKINQKILEVTSKIMELVAGEVSSAGDFSAVCSFMKERGDVEKDHFLDEVIEDQPPLISLDGAREGNQPERCLHPLFRDCRQKDREIPQHDQVCDEKTKEVKEEEAYVCGEEGCMEEATSPELPTGSTQEGYNPPNHYQDENLVIIKQEDKGAMIDGEQRKEEEISPRIITDWRLSRGIQELPPDFVVNGEMQSDDYFTLGSSHVTIPHLQSINRQEKTFSCTVCGKCFSQKSHVIRHKQVHTGEKPYSCSECGRRFSLKTSLIQHERIHTGEKPYSCSVCGKCFPQKTNLIRHERVHTGEKPYSCSECGRCFSVKTSLIQHERVHTGEKPFCCTECGRCFSQKPLLIQHKRIHTGEKPYSCSDCGKCFAQKSNFVSHKEIHMREKLYSCSDCGISFSQKLELSRHKQVHTGRTLYSCLKCGKCFSEKASLVVHERVHTGEKPYSCPECGKCFSRRSSFFTHKKIHTGEKPFSCSECRRCFACKSSLIRHEQSHTRKNAN